MEKNLLWLTDSFGDKLDIRIADIRNQQLLEQAVADARHVFHLSAQVAVTTSIDNPAEDFAINGCGTFSLLEAIRKAADPPSLLFTSTNKVYGGISGVSIERNQYRYEPTDPELRKYGVPEDISLDFLSPYGCSKGSADQYVLDYARTYGIAATVFRMSCIYGPHQFGTEDQGWVAHFAIRTLCNCPITLYGDGCQVRDILYVDDLVNAMVEAARIMPRISGQAFNIGGGPGRTVSLVELLQRLQDLHGSLPQIRYGEWRTGDQRYYVSDIRKFREASGWSPGCTVDDGVRNLYEWLSAMMNIPRAKSAGNLYRRQESYSPVVEAMR